MGLGLSGADGAAVLYCRVCYCRLRIASSFQKWALQELFLKVLREILSMSLFFGHPLAGDCLLPFWLPASPWFDDFVGRLRWYLGQLL